ncbi:hypothetical protein [uncultured Rikenella sp.]|uniref:hypothetical protein n=1 Tax=uncultured Rikenella sp. TaxID=368003 RepID=UPI00263713AB|nr:hypothetical protein [uncultured Rikenella sp.]
MEMIKMYNNQFGYNPYMQPFNNNFNQPLQNSAVNTQSSAVNSAVSSRQVLNGKLVDSIDVVKAIDIPLDGSVSYFPLTNNSAIVTKQLLTDGTSKTTIYKPIEEKETPKVQYVTMDDLKKSIKEIDLSEIDDLKDEIKDLKAEIKKIKKGD